MKELKNDFKVDKVEEMTSYGIPHVATSYIKNNLPKNSVPLNEFMRRLEKEIIFKALKVCNGNKKNTALILGLKYSTLTEKIKAMNVKFEKKIFFDKLYLEN
jgi:DNA-binding NtrC family response regulator